MRESLYRIFKGQSRVRERAFLNATVLSMSILVRSVPALPQPSSASAALSESRIAQSIVVSTTSITGFSPRARSDVVQEIVRNWSEAEAVGINNPRRIQQFFAELAVETGGLTLLEEDLNYSVAGLIRVWPERFNVKNAAIYAGNPQKLANYVYGGRLGNKAGTDDGWKFRGSGLIQLTGRSNFGGRGKQLGIGNQLEESPDLVRRPPMAFKAAYAYWAFCGASSLADADNTSAVRKVVNGSTNGLSTTQIWLVRARRAFPLSAGVTDAQAVQQDETAAVLSRLQELGYSEPAAPTSSAAAKSALENGLARFQKDNGLTATGTLDDDTLYKLTDPQRLRRP